MVLTMQEPPICGPDNGCEIVESLLEANLTEEELMEDLLKESSEVNWRLKNVGHFVKNCKDHVEKEIEHVKILLAPYKDIEGYENMIFRQFEVDGGSISQSIEKLYSSLGMLKDKIERYKKYRIINGKETK